MKWCRVDVAGRAILRYYSVNGCGGQRSRSHQDKNVLYTWVSSKSFEIRIDFGRWKYGMKTVVVVTENFTHRSATLSLFPASEIMFL